MNELKDNNLAPKLGSTVVQVQHQGVNRNIRGDMFRRLFFVTFFLRKKKVKKDERCKKVELPATSETRDKDHKSQQFSTKFEIKP